MTDIADAAGADPRSLRRGFLHHLGASPVTYLRHVRLQRAHDDLATSETAAQEDVAAVARRWGFVSTRRFR